MQTVLIGAWLASALLGCIMGGQRDAIGFGFVLGLFFGPLGLVAALTLDERPQCPRCHGRVNRLSLRGLPTKSPAVCQHCHVQINWTTDPPSIASRR